MRTAYACTTITNIFDCSFKAVNSLTAVRIFFHERCPAKPKLPNIIGSAGEHALPDLVETGPPLQSNGRSEGSACGQAEAEYDEGPT
jgi:hypothetical protein